MNQSKFNFVSKILPPNYVVVHSKAISYLYDNYPEIYEKFYELIDGSGNFSEKQNSDCNCLDPRPAGNAKGICLGCGGSIYKDEYKF